jgi:hypothetical protein
MSQPYGPLGGYDLVIGGPGHSPDGKLSLTYNPANIASCASFTYLSQPNANAQTVVFAFTGPDANGVYSATCSMPPPNQVNIPGQGQFQYGTLAFTPPSTTSPGGKLTGSFSNTAPGGPIGDDPVNWEADPSTPEEATRKAASPGKY